MSNDGINAGQARKFAKKFNLANLQLIEGFWVAEDDGEPYRITAATYYAALASGDLR